MSLVADAATDEIKDICEFTHNFAPRLGIVDGGHLQLPDNNGSLRYRGMCECVSCSQVLFDWYIEH